MNERIKLSEELAKGVAAYVQQRFFEGVRHERKADGTLVTEVDKEAEHRIRKGIRAAFPDDAIVGEEHEYESGESGITWYVDPIDGTKNFAHGVPFFAVSIGYADAKGPLGGVIAVPMLNALYVAEKGKGALRNGEKMSIRGTWDSDRPLLFVNARKREPRLQAMYAMDTSPSVRAIGSSCVSLALFADGAAEGLLGLHMNTWDFVAGVVLATEAGATCKILGAEKIDFSGETSFLLAAPEHIDQFTDLMKSLDE